NVLRMALRVDLDGEHHHALHSHPPGILAVLRFRLPDHHGSGQPSRSASTGPEVIPTRAAILAGTDSRSIVIAGAALSAVAEAAASAGSLGGRPGGAVRQTELRQVDGRDR